eukprot:891057-Prorocentrum_minimum.AAC.1
MRRSRRGALRLRPRRRRGTPACSAGRSPGTPRRTCDSFSTRGYGREDDGNAGTCSTLSWRRPSWRETLLMSLSRRGALGSSTCWTTAATRTQLNLLDASSAELNYVVTAS